ncbi:MAG: hypothetical protein II998_08190, partial [Clostridia bacterium]|nr:hypothetical protein [Clostridia bacterium]
MIKNYSQSDLLKLDVSNSIWINSDTTTQRFSEEYKSNLVDIFNATSDVVTNQNALEKINGWV